MFADPGVEGFLDCVSVVVGEPAVGGEKIVGFMVASAPTSAGARGIPDGEGCFMCGTEPGLVVFTDLEVAVDGVALVVAAVRYFTHGQAGRVHHVPLGVP